jgi:cytochrome c-type biogenesis protein
MLRAVLTSISLGLLATTSPCVLPLYPGFLAYLSGRQESTGRRPARYFLGFFVLAGVLCMMLALGLAIALLAVPVGSALAVLLPLADLAIVALGVLLLTDHNPFKGLPQARVPLLKNPFLNAFVYGLLYGPIAMPCSGPLVVSVFALSLTAGEALSTLSTFLWFGLGFGLPLLGLSLVSGASQRWITVQFARHGRTINLVAGALLVIIGAYDLWSNRDLVRLFL